MDPKVSRSLGGVVVVAPLTTPLELGILHFHEHNPQEPRRSKPVDVQGKVSSPMTLRDPCIMVLGYGKVYSSSPRMTICSSVIKSDIENEVPMKAETM